MAIELWAAPSCTESRGRMFYRVWHVEAQMMSPLAADASRSIQYTANVLAIKMGRIQLYTTSKYAYVQSSSWVEGVIVPRQ